MVLNPVYWIFEISTEYLLYIFTYTVVLQVLHSGEKGRVEQQRQRLPLGLLLAAALWQNFLQKEKGLPSLCGNYDGPQSEGCQQAAIL